MTDLLRGFSLPWYVVGMFWLFLGGLLFHKGFRDEVDAVLANMMGMKPKNKRNKP